MHLNLVLQSMTDQLKSTMDMAKMYRELGDTTETTNSMKSAKDLMNEMAQVRKTLADLKASNTSDELVDLYLSKGGATMGVDVSNKKQKSD